MHFSALVAIGYSAAVAGEAPVVYAPGDTGYVREIAAAEPLAHWRLSGAAGSPVGDGTARAFGSPVTLDTADLGGSAFSVETWFRGVDGTILSYGTGGERALTVENRERLVVTLLGERVDTGVALPADGWHHLGLTWDGSEGLLRVFVDGRPAATVPLGKGQPLPTGGALVAGASLTGELDEIALYTEPLSGSRFLSHVLVARGLRPPSTPVPELPVGFVALRGHAWDLDGAVDVSPDGALVVTTAEDGVVRLWDLGTERELRSLGPPGPRVHDLAFSPEGGGCWWGTPRACGCGTRRRARRRWSWTTPTVSRTRSRSIRTGPARSPASEAR